MAKNKIDFTIREQALATVLEITPQELDKIIFFFDSDPNEKWYLQENVHFIYLNKILNERLFSEQGVYKITKYIDEKESKSLREVVKNFISRHKEKIRDAFISRKIQENCSSLTVKNNRQFLSKKDVIKILCTNALRFDKAFEEIQKSHDPMRIYEDFDDIDGIRYYALSGFYKISKHLAKSLTVKDRSAWCGSIEFVGNKTFKMIADEQTSLQKRIDSAMNSARKRDSSRCQITKKKRDKFNKSINIVVHHIYSKEHYSHLAACQDNLITLTQEVHNEFHAWNGGCQKPCTVVHLIQFVNELYPDNYEVILRLNKIKNMLDV